MGQILSDVKDILNYQNSKQENKSSKNQILEQMTKDEGEKQNLVKKVLAAQRAKYGASGMSSKGLTEQAVLERIKQETEKPYETKRQTNLNKLKNMNTKKKNLLVSVLEHMDNLIK
jgi:hypothetical protein